MINKNIPVIIPAYEPDDRMIHLLENLRKTQITNVVIVNDGSDKTFDWIFEKARVDFGYTVLKHYVNMGKGRALKTAFNYCLSEYPYMIGCVTADSDGQHTIEDIKKCIFSLEEDKDSLILGCRDFNQEDVPSKSRMGNKITRKVCKWLCGIDVADTQTGLRAIPKCFMEYLLNVPGERFEFETNMLIETKENCKIKEIVIQTVYDSKENHTTHFDPIKDSIKIYKIFGKYFFRFIISSFSSCVIDLAIFYFMCSILKVKYVSLYILFATIIARIFSSIYNYFINYKFVFNSHQKHLNSLVRYYILVFIQMLASAVLVTVIFSLIKIVPEIIVKIFVDIFLFLVSFWIQREKIFNN